MRKNFTKRPFKKAAIFFAFLFTGIISANAQVYLGGGFSYHTTEDEDVFYKDKIKNFTISPEVGYEFSHFAVGLAVGFQSTRNHLSFSVSDVTFQYHDYNSTNIMPYFRWNVVKKNRVAFFIDATWEHCILTDIFHQGHEIDGNREETIEKDSRKANFAGIRPGISLSITDHLSALMHFGIIGYSSDYDFFGFEKFGVDLSMSTASLSFYYIF